MAKTTIENHSCLRCKHTQHEVGKIFASGGLLSSLMNYENREFTTVTCVKCKHTELYDAEKAVVLQLIADGTIE